MNLGFAHPEFLGLLLLVPVVAVLARRGRGAVPVPDAARVAARRRGIAAAPAGLRLLAIVLTVVALARPRSAGGETEVRTEGVPTVVAIDVSSSMLAQDWSCDDPPCTPAAQGRDRLQVAKETVERFIAARPSDPVGLVAFAAEAITLAPVTTHQALLREALRSARVGLVEDGTAIGDGLATAVNRLRRVPGESRVVVLMSDGESNRGSVEPLAAAQAAARFGIRVHTIGVGSEGLAQVPVGRVPGGFEYAERPVAIDEATLMEIARLTGGEYHRATDPAALERIYARIDQMVRAPVESRTIVLYREWYLWLLAVAAGALVLEWAMRGSRWGAIP